VGGDLNKDGAVGGQLGGTPESRAPKTAQKQHEL